MSTWLSEIVRRLKGVVYFYFLQKAPFLGVATITTTTITIFASSRSFADCQE